MGGRRRSRRQAALLAENPLEGEQLLLDAMFGGDTDSSAGATLRPARAAPRPTPPKPKHYKVVSISLYVEDIQRLEGMVRELKRRGHFKANKSQLIRYALSQVDLDSVPRDL